MISRRTRTIATTRMMVPAPPSLSGCSLCFSAERILERHSTQMVLPSEQGLPHLIQKDRQGGCFSSTGTAPVERGRQLAQSVWPSSQGFPHWVQKRRRAGAGFFIFSVSTSFGACSSTGGTGAILGTGVIGRRASTSSGSGVPSLTQNFARVSITLPQVGQRGICLPHFTQNLELSAISSLHTGHFIFYAPFPFSCNSQ